MNKFKKGDRVRIHQITSPYYLKFGFVDKVNYNKYLIYVEDSECFTYVREGCLTLDKPQEPPTEQPKEGRKDDDGKIDYTLLLQDLHRAVDSVVKVLQFGANKYGRSNYSKVSSERYDRANLRHVMEHLRGNLLDKDTNEPHLSHAVCCLLFEIERQLKDKENTDE